MKQNSVKVLTFTMFVVLFVVVTGVSQSPQKTAAEPVGVLNTGAESVIVNGAPAPRGSTVFNGNEIRTGDEAATVNLASGGGVLSIGPESRVKISRDQAKIIAEVLKGSVTMRTPLASTVIAPDRTVNSEADNLYRVSVSDSGTAVQSFLKSVAVKTADGAVQTIAAEAMGAVAAAASDSGDTPAPAQPEQVTPERGCFISAECKVDGTTLVVSGIVLCQGNPVGGETVRLMVTFRAARSERVRLTTTTIPSGAMAGRYSFTVTNPNVPDGGVAVVMIRRCGASCPAGVGGRTQCSF
ncbi:MAG: hypothetical protein HY314_08015 [Acidobacteria bacterium]|nr:hypothetical protein [Acidobacteriota bacterium]